MKLSFSGVISVSASECATWLSRVCEPGQSMMMNSASFSSPAIAADSRRSWMFSPAARLAWSTSGRSW